MACHGRHPSRDTDGCPQEGCDIPRPFVVIESTNEISVKACQYDHHDTDDTNGNPQEGYDISRAPPVQACMRGSAVVMESTKEISVKAFQYDCHPSRDANGYPLKGYDIPGPIMRTNEIVAVLN